MNSHSGMDLPEPGMLPDSKLNVLILDDEKHFTEELREFLEHTGFSAIEANTVRQGLDILKDHEIDLLILDILLPDANGLEVLKDVKEKYPQMEVIIISAHGDMDTVIQALRLGAIDYLRKPFRHNDIRIAISRTRKFLLLQQKIKQIEERNSLISKHLEEKIERHFIGVSDKIRKVLEIAMKAASFPDTNVLISGESGTGKENIARIIHYESVRKDNLLVTVNSSAINESLMESEFFGHKKGAFTGAVSDKKGFFEICNHGTLFLDEISDMPWNLQAKVLRAIEEKQITRVGETTPIRTDFRLISATNHDIHQLVEEKKFRLDLLHRLDTLHIHIPPLRERSEDIEPLLLYFLEDFAIKTNKPVPGISNDVISNLGKYSFPGNVRELKNLAERAIILAGGDHLTTQDFFIPVSVRSNKAQKGSTLASNEIKLIRETLHNTNYDQSAAAKDLGISRDALIRKMNKYNIRILKKEQ